MFGISQFNQYYGSILARDRRSVPTRREARADYERALQSQLFGIWR